MKSGIGKMHFPNTAFLHIHNILLYFSIVMLTHPSLPYHLLHFAEKETPLLLFSRIVVVKL